MGTTMRGRPTLAAEDCATQVQVTKKDVRRIKARAWQLEQEALKGKPTECCQGCGFVTRADKIEWHEINVCPKRIVGCELCGQQLPFDMLGAHRSHQCLNRLLDCAHLERGCTEKVTAENYEAHVAQRRQRSR